MPRFIITLKLFFVIVTSIQNYVQKVTPQIVSDVLIALNTEILRVLKYKLRYNIVFMITYLYPAFSLQIDFY